MPSPHPYFATLQQMVIDVALIDRSHYLADTARHENDIEHSYAVTLLAWFIHDHYNIPLDLSKILRYALAHDLVERYAGDTNTFAPADARKAKTIAEAKSLKRLAKEFAAFPDLVTIMHDYEAKADDEALFVWTVDKMQALILGDLDNWRPYEELSISYDAFCKKYLEELLPRTSPYTRQIYDSLVSYCQSTYWNAPKD